MKNIARRIINTLFPARKNYTATIAYSGLIYHVNIEAPDERRARIHRWVLFCNQHSQKDN